MRPFKRVKMLDADEYRLLKRAVTSHKIAAGKASRAKIVLLSNQGLTAREIAARLECNERTALKWIGRFNHHGVAGLDEVLRSGRPRVYGPDWNDHRPYVWGGRRRRRAARKPGVAGPPGVAAMPGPC
jgi:hypothetical protein